MGAAYEISAARAMLYHTADPADPWLYNFYAQAVRPGWRRPIGLHVDREGVLRASGSLSRAVRGRLELPVAEVRAILAWLGESVAVASGHRVCSVSVTRERWLFLCLAHRCGRTDGFWASIAAEESARWQPSLAPWDGERQTPCPCESLEPGPLAPLFERAGDALLATLPAGLVAP